MINRKKSKEYFKEARIDTPLGQMIAIASEEALYLLEFIDRKGLEREIERMRKRTKLPITDGETPPIISIEKELQQYFSGALKEFKTPIEYRKNNGV